jgi:hypothetical protein
MRQTTIGGLLASIACILAAGACSGNTSAPTPAASEHYLAAVSDSKSGSGINTLPQRVALTLGNGLCSQLEQGQPVSQVAESFADDTGGRFPPAAAAELLVDSAGYLCPGYLSDVREWVSG